MSARVLVTGGTGFLGRHLVDLLLQRQRSPKGEANKGRVFSARSAVRQSVPRLRGADCWTRLERVRVLTRAATPELDALGVEVVEGSLTDADTLAAAVKGVTRVYHCAGLVSRDPDAAPQLYRVHVDGTRLLLEAAVAARVERVVVVSTSGTIAVSRDGEHVATEADDHALELVKTWPYYLSKIYQEKLALRVAREGKLEVVVVNPSLLLGPGDARLSSTGDVLRFLKRDIPVVPSGGMNFVDARDAAAGAILAMERGKSGERYLFGGPNWTMAEFFARLARVSGVRAPTARIPDAAARFSTRLVDALYRLKGPESRAPLDPVSVELSQHFWWLDATKARTELGWEPRDPMETLDDTVADLRERNLGGAPRQRKAPSFLEQLVTRISQERPPPPRAKRAASKGKRAGRSKPGSPARTTRD